MSFKGIEIIMSNVIVRRKVSKYYAYTVVKRITNKEVKQARTDLRLVYFNGQQTW